MEKLFWKILQIPMAYFFVELEAYVFNFTKKEATVGVPQKSIFLEHLREAASLLSCHEEV